MAKKEKIQPIWMIIGILVIFLLVNNSDPSTQSIFSEKENLLDQPLVDVQQISERGNTQNISLAQKERFNIEIDKIIQDQIDNPENYDTVKQTIKIPAMSFFGDIFGDIGAQSVWSKCSLSNFYVCGINRETDGSASAYAKLSVSSSYYRKEWNSKNHYVPTFNFYMNCIGDQLTYSVSSGTDAWNKCDDIQCGGIELLSHTKNWWTINMERDYTLSLTASQLSAMPRNSNGITYFYFSCYDYDGDITERDAWAWVESGWRLGLYTANTAKLVKTCSLDSDCNAGMTCDIKTDMCVQQTCIDGIKNQDETNPDCGGVCGGYWYDLSCNALPKPTCNDGIKNQDETAIDCEGVCGGYWYTNTCHLTPEPSCFDHFKNQDETGNDCGGVCGGYWYNNVCNSIPEPTCYDNILNQGEQETDCGGPCLKECTEQRDTSVLSGEIITLIPGESHTILVTITDLNKLEGVGELIVDVSYDGGINQSSGSEVYIWEFE